MSNRFGVCLRAENTPFSFKFCAKFFVIPDFNYQFLVTYDRSVFDKRRSIISCNDSSVADKQHKHPSNPYERSARYSGFTLFVKIFPIHPFDTFFRPGYQRVCACVCAGTVYAASRL